MFVQVPANTFVLMNSYYIAHNPEVYEDPFTVKPDRFLDATGQLVDRDHPLRQKLVLTYICPSPYFMLLAEFPALPGYKNQLINSGR